jgi:DNA-binding NarL/FixJ family response regulator
MDAKIHAKLDAALAQPITVVVVDDDRFVRDSMRLMLHDTDITVVAACGSAADAYAAIAEHRPLVAIVDLLMHGDPRAGIELIARVVQGGHDTACMILTHIDPDGIQVRDAFAAGARGFYRKDYLPGDDLPHIARKLARGERVIEPALVDQLLAGINPHAALAPPTTGARRHVFSGREREILTYVNEGLNARQIAERMVLSEATVKTHLAHARRKFGNAMNSHQLAVYALLRGLL